MLNKNKNYWCLLKPKINLKNKAPLHLLLGGFNLNLITMINQQKEYQFIASNIRINWSMRVSFTCQFAVILMNDGNDRGYCSASKLVAKHQ